MPTNMSRRGFSNIPICKRNWLRIYRKSQGYKSMASITNLIGFKYNTYGALEGGSSYNTKNMTLPTLNQIADRLGVPIDLFYHPCTEEGLLYEEDSIQPFIIFFRTNGFPNIATSTLLDYIFEHTLHQHIIEVYGSYTPTLIYGYKND